MKDSFKYIFSTGSVTLINDLKRSVNRLWRAIPFLLWAIVPFFVQAQHLNNGKRLDSLHRARAASSVLRILTNVYNVTGGGTYCSGGSGVVVGLDGSEAGGSYQLQLNGVDLGAPIAGTGNAISFGNQTAAGTYTVVGTVAGTPATMTGNVAIAINDVTAGVIATNQTICNSDDPAAFTETTTATGSGALTYQWQSSTTDCTNGFTDIGGSTSATYDVPAGLAATTYYRRIVTSTLNGVSCSATSNCVTVTINNITAGSISGDQTICAAGDPSAFTSLDATGTGTISYQWQSSTTNCTTGFADIGGSTSATYDVPAGLAATTYYRRIVTSTLNGVSCSATSNCVTVTINNITAGSISGDQTICAAGDPSAFTSVDATGTGTISYQWQSSTTDCTNGFANISGATSSTYDVPSGLATTTYYRRIATSTINGVPCTATSNCVTVTINNITAGSISGDQTICAAGDPSAFTSVAATGSGTISYQWQSSTTSCAAGFADISGATSATYDAPSGLATTTYYRRIATSTLNGVPCTATSNCVTVTINNITAGSISGDQTICAAGDPSAFTSVAATGSGPIIYQWQSSTTDCAAGFADISGATSSSYDVTSGLATTTYYRRIATSTINGVPCTATSNCVTVTVNNITAGSISGDQTICAAGDPSAFTSVAATGSGPITYQWQSSTTSCAAGFADISGATSETYDAISGLATTTYYRRIATSTLNGVPCTTTSNCVTVTINNITAGSISGDQTICAAGDPSAFTSVAATGSGPITYQWQSSTTSCAAGFADISGATSATYDAPSGLATTTYYRRIVTSTLNGTCTATSNCVTVTVNAVTAGSIGSDQTICSGGDPAAFTSVVATGSGPITYQWQSSTTDCTNGFSNISGATSATYDVPSGLITTTYYRRIATSTLNGAPCTATSNCVTVTVNAVTAGSISGDQTICAAGDPSAFTSVAATGSGPITYQWQSSTTSCAAGFADISGATSATYDAPSGLATTTYYRRIVTSTLNGTCTATSNCVTVTVNAVTAGSIGSDQTICSGGDPAAFTSVAATGSGPITYQWQSSTTDCTNGFSNISGATSATYDVPSGLITTTYYRRIATSTLNGVPCTATSNCATVTVNNATAGTIGTDQTICSGGDPTAFTIITAATGSGPLTYQWQSSTTSCAAGFSNIAGATSATYDVPAGLATTTYYKRIVTSTLSGTCTATSNCVTVTINNVTAGTVGTDQTICNGGDPAAFTSVAATGSGVLTYQWQSSTTSCAAGFADISGATSATYDAPSGLAATTYYRRIATSTLNGALCSATSNCATVTVNGVTAGTVGTDQTICSGGDPAAFTVTTAATGSGPLTYQWQSSTTSCAAGFSNIAGATSATYDVPAGLATTTYYKRIVTSTLSGTCTATSNCVTVTINNVTAGAIAADQTICSGGDPTAFSITTTATGSGALSYQWQSSTTSCAAGFVDISGATSATYDAPTGLAVTTYYRRISTSTLNGVTCTATSNCATVTINSVTAGVIATSQTICSGGDPAAFTVTTAATGSGPITYQWQSSTTDCTNGFANISGATVATYDAPSGLAVTTYYRRIATSTLSGVPCTAISNCVTVTINNVAAGTLGTDQTICSGGDPAAFTEITAATGGGTLTYQWQSSTTSCAAGFSNIAGVTSATYDVPAGLATTTYYKRIVTSTLNGTCTATSNCVTVTINTVTAGVIGTSQTICSGGDPGAFTVPTAATGSGALTYQWQSSTTDCTNGFSNIGGATAATYDAPAGLAVTTFYRRIATSTLNGVLCTATSNCVTVTINGVTAGTVGTDQTICSGGDPAAFTVTTAATGSGPLTYQWQSSTTSCAAGFSNIGSATGTTYDVPAGLATTTYYKRIVTSTLSGTCTATSNCVTVTINTLTAGAIGSDQTICSGGDPAAFTVTTAATGAGTLTYQWQSSTTSCAAGFADISGATSATYDAPTGLAVTTYYRRIAIATFNGVPCNAISNCATVTINTVTAGSISADQTICSGGDPNAFTSVAATGVGSISYQWQSSTTDCTTGFTNIPGATSATYNVAAGLLVTTYYRRVATSTLNGVPCTATSNCVTVTVNNVTAGTIGSDQTICSGGDPAAFTVITAATGGGTLTYQWQSNTTSCAGSFSNISGATSVTYDVPAGLATTTYYKRTVTSTLNGTCTATSNCVTVTVNTLPAAPTSPVSASRCGTGTVNLSATTSAGTTIDWYDAASGGNLVGTGTTFTTPSISTTTTYYAQARNTSTGCVSTTRTAATATINALPTVTVSPASAAFCSGNSVTLTASGASTYTWSPSTNLSITTGSIVIAYPDVTTTYTVTGTGANGCTGTATVTITVTQSPSGDVSSSPGVCPGANSGTLTLSNYTGNILRWESSTDGGSTWTTISNTTTSQSYLNLTTTTIYRVYMELNGCYAYSSIGIVPVNPPFTPTVTATPTIFCLGNSAVLKASDYGPPPFPVEDFQNANPAGWSGNDANSNNKDDNSPWGETGNGKTFNGKTFNSNAPPTNTKFMIANGDGGGGPASLITPPFSLVGVISPTFNYYTALNFNAGTTGYVEISTDGGLTYTTLKTYTGPTNVGTPNNGFIQESINLSAYIGQTNVMVRFRYNGTAGSNWALDNVGIAGTYQPVTYQWSPTTYLTPATGVGQTVTTTPTVAGTFNYCVVATTAAGCASSPVCVDVTAKPIPTCSITGNVTVCPGSTNVYSAPATAGYTYNWTISGGATISGSATGQTVTVIANNTCGTYTLKLITTLNGCSSPQCTQVVNVVDNTAPVATAPATQSFQCLAAVPAPGTLTATDNCSGNITKTGVDVQVANGCGYTITRTWTFTDACNNTTSVSQIINVLDNTAPVAPAAPASQSYQCLADVPAPGTLTAIDNCSGNITKTGVDVQVANGCGYTITRTWTFTDACNNTSSVSQIINVLDNTAPVAPVAPASQSYQCLADVPAPGTLTAIDNCSGNIIKTGVDVQVANGCGYTITRTWTFTDACNNTSSVSQIINVLDNTPPVITCPPAQTFCAVNNNTYTIPPATASDNCSGTLNITYQITGATTRSGTGTNASGVFNIGISTITWTVTDACGNTATCTTTVTVNPKPTTTITHN